METGQFQSLIGRLQTDARIKALKVESEFQSLIGRLQTLLEWEDREGFKQFQSLIGRLQTNIMNGGEADGTQGFNSS